VGSTKDEVLPTVSNGRYYNDILVCDDGYKNVDWKCTRLPTVSNGRYYNDILVCDDGYKNVDWKCTRLPHR
jgi:hypothetical protein